VKQLVELGKKATNVLTGHFGPETNRDQLCNEINDGLTKLAMEITGCRADQLADDNLEDKPIVRLFWTTLAELTAKMYLYAAQEQSYYREADR
jgi:hypothetical protein